MSNQKSVKWSRVFDDLEVLNKNIIKEVPVVDLETIIENSNNFPIKFPIDSTRITTLKSSVDEKNLKTYVNSAYPVIHELGLFQSAKVLQQKRKFGSNIERSYYQNITLLDFIDRVLTKRAVSFVGPQDKYLLIDNTNGVGNWEKVGTPDEAAPLLLQDALSYDEIKLSALLSVSSHSQFINNGNRNNKGIPENDRENDGVIIGVIGPRLEKEYVMEYREIMKTPSQNTHIYGYGESFVPTVQSVFSSFYGTPSLTYEELQWAKVLDSDNFIKVGDDKYFEISSYRQRIGFSIDTLLIEANARAKNENKQAFVHVVGLGLESWKITPEQNKLFLETFVDHIESLGKSLGSVSDVDFSHTNETTAGKYKNNDTIPIEGHPKGGITIYINNREPSEKLTGSDEGKLLVVSYNWNGNALPGNEFWLNDLTAGDGSAAASSSQIAELHNPHINPKVQASNLKVVTPDGLFTFKEYQDLHKDD